MLSILIPTMNRSEFVIRLLSYYHRLRFPHTILIGDSSGDEHRTKILYGIARIQKELRVVYHHLPNHNNYEVTQALLGKTETPYASYLADDDFLIPETIEECIQFMEQNSDYSGACGRAALFKLTEHGVYGEVDATSPYPAYNIEDEDPALRLMSHASRYTSTFHSVCRTPLLKKALRQTSLFKQEAKKGEITWWTAESFGELSTSWSLVAQGKIKCLPSLYYFRQVHDARYLFPNWFDWITSPTWQNCSQTFMAQIEEDLAEKGVAKEKAREVIRAAFWRYLAAGANNKLRAKKEAPFWKKELKTVMKALPMVKKSWRWLRSFKEEMALEALLKERSAHYRRFKPLYTLITRQEEGGV